MTGWAWDLLQVLRRLRRTPGFTAAAVATLGVAVAACAVALAFGWAAVLQPVSLFPHRDRLVDIQSTRGKGPDDRFGVYPADFVAWKAAQTSFAAFGAYVPIGEVDLTGGGGAAEPLQLHTHLATADVFRALGVPPALGRVFVAADEEAGNDRVALLSAALWRRLGADPGVVGGTLRLNGEPYWVVGVMPPGFGLRGNVPDLWLPLAFGPQRPADRSTGTLVVLGRLRPGVDLARAGAELDAIGAALATEFADTNRDLRPSLRPLVPLLSETVRPTVRLLLGAVAVVLLVAMVNLGNLLLGRALARRGELALHATLGASPARLARQVLCEGALLAVLAAAAGVALAVAALRALPDLQGQFLFPSIELRLGPPVVALAILLALLAGALASLAPALRAASTAAFGAPRPVATASRDRWSRRFADALVVAQIAVTLALLSGGALLARSLAARLKTDLGYDAAHVLSFEVAPPSSRYPGDAELVRVSDRLRDELESVPGVEVAASSDHPPGAGWSVSVWPGGGRGAEPEPVRMTLHLVTPGYFEALAVPLVAGRPLRAADHAGAPRVALLSRSGARRLYGDRPAVGQDVAVDDRGDVHRVVGVVPDLLPDATAEAKPAVYVAYAQHASLLDVVGQRRRVVLVRAAGDPAALAASVAAAVHRVDAQLPVSALQPLATRLAGSSFRPRLATQMLVVFSLLALGLAAVGLYTLSAEGMARRRREVGIRVALGADRAEIVRLFARPAAATVAAGVGLGLSLAVAGGGLLRGLLFAVGPLDPPALACAVAVLVLAMGAAIVGPVRRSLRVDPREALAEG